MSAMSTLLLSTVITAYRATIDPSVVSFGSPADVGIMTMDVSIEAGELPARATKVETGVEVFPNDWDVGSDDTYACVTKATFGTLTLRVVLDAASGETLLTNERLIPLVHEVVGMESERAPSSCEDLLASGAEQLSGTSGHGHSLRVTLTNGDSLVLTPFDDGLWLDAVFTNGGTRSTLDLLQVQTRDGARTLHWGLHRKGSTSSLFDAGGLVVLQKL